MQGFLAVNEYRAEQTVHNQDAVLSETREVDTRKITIEEETIAINYSETKVFTPFIGVGIALK